MKRDPVYENYTYAQQSNSLKMVILWLPAAVAAHIRKGRAEGKPGVDQFAAKIARMLRWVADVIEQIR